MTLLEYGDYECQYCAAAHPAVETVRAVMGDSLRFAYRNFPLTAVRRHAWAAAESAEAAGAQDRFWPMHDLLYEDQRRLGTADLVAKARPLDLDLEAFAEAVDDDAFAPASKPTS